MALDYALKFPCGVRKSIPEPNIEQFKTLMCAIVMAGRLNAAIGTEP